MAFEPKSGEHAITEAVFGLNFARPFTNEEVERVAAAHDEWRHLLPRFSRGSGFQIDFGDVPVAAASSPIAFDRLRPDGSFEWRLRVEGSQVYFNCMAYTRWAEIWPLAARHLLRVVELAGAATPVRSILLQYIDLFEWQAKRDDYDLGQLLAPGEIVPKSVLTRGPLWHLHQGWFRKDAELPDGRLLERLHFDGVYDEKGTPIVRVDSFLSFELASPVKLSKNWTKRKGDAGDWFEVLHRLDKKLLGMALTKKMADRIDLNV